MELMDFARLVAGKESASDLIDELTEYAQKLTDDRNHQIDSINARRKSVARIDANIKIVNAAICRLTERAKR